MPRSQGRPVLTPEETALRLVLPRRLPSGSRGQRGPQSITQFLDVTASTASAASTSRSNSVTCSTSRATTAKRGRSENWSGLLTNQPSILPAWRLSASSNSEMAAALPARLGASAAHIRTAAEVFKNDGEAPSLPRQHLCAAFVRILCGPRERGQSCFDFPARPRIDSLSARPHTRRGIRPTRGRRQQALPTYAHKCRRRLDAAQTMRGRRTLQPASSYNASSSSPKR